MMAIVILADQSVAGSGEIHEQKQIRELALIKDVDRRCIRAGQVLYLEYGQYQTRRVHPEVPCHSELFGLESGCGI